MIKWKSYLPHQILLVGAPRALDRVGVLQHKMQSRDTRFDLEVHDVDRGLIVDAALDIRGDPVDELADT